MLLLSWLGALPTLNVGGTLFRPQSQRAASLEQQEAAAREALAARDTEVQRLAALVGQRGAEVAALQAAEAKVRRAAPGYWQGCRLCFIPCERSLMSPPLYPTPLFGAA